ncbi:MAG: hypothetical protein U0573_07430 [Phycisphaerales bacterium]|nr:HEAT repeat domain-containing protein [Planctomycetota bacterium]
MNIRTIASAAFVLALVGGCASKQAAKAPQSQPEVATKPAVAAAAPKAPPPDAIRLSQIREKALRTVEESASSPDGQVRGYAANAASLVPNRLGDILVKTLDDPLPGPKAMAAMSAGRARYQPAAARIAPLLSDPSPFVRMASIYALTKLGRPVDPTAVAGWLMNGETPQIRSQAAWVLGEIGNKSAIPMLKDAAVKGITKVRPIEVTIFQLQCGEARIKLGDNDPIEGIRAALFPASPDELEGAVLAVQIIGEVKDRRSMDQLIYLADQRDAKGNFMPAEFRMECAMSLAKLGLDKGSFIADEYAADPNPTIRAQAASVYGYTARPEHFLILENMLSDPSPFVRVVAASAIIRAHARLSGEALPY